MTKFNYKIEIDVIRRASKEFPKTDFVIKAEGYDNPEEWRLFGGLIQDLKTLTQEAKNVTNAAREVSNETHQIINNSIN